MAFEAGRETGPISFHIGNDPAELALLLPPRARKRFEILSLRRDDAHRLIPEGESVRALGAEKFSLERAIEKMQARRPEGDFLGDDDLRVTAAKSRLARLAEEVQAIRERYETRGQVFAAIARTHTDAMEWIRSRPPNTAIEDAVELKLNGKAPLVDQLENVRRRGRELAADLNRIRSSCYPSSHCKEKAAAEIEALAERGRIGVSQLIEHDGALQWPAMTMQSSVFNAQPVEGMRRAIGFVNDVPDAIGVLAFIHRAALLSAINNEIDAEADDENSLSQNEREVRESEILGDILENDRIESALMFRLWADGQSVLPRPDLAPSAVLNVQLTQVPPGFGSPGVREGFEPR